VSGYASWDFEQGEELQPGRAVLKAIGGGNRYEVCLVWDEGLYALAVAKVLRLIQARAGPGRGGTSCTPTGTAPRYSLCRCSSFLPITMRWISEVPSPISSSGASR
jgi:hypothetical protein